MKPVRRGPVSKGHSAAKFRHQVSKTKGANFAQVRRGGIRF